MDKLFIGYLCATALGLLCFRTAIPRWHWLLAGHVAASLAVLALAKGRSLPARLFHDWYPLLYILGCYAEMNEFIESLWGALTMDPILARIDLVLFSAPASALHDRFPSPLATEFLQIIYASFFVALVVPFVLLHRKRRTTHAHYYAFLVSLGFLASYAGYFAVPAFGPRGAGALSQDLHGVWSFEHVRAGLDWIEGRYRDCFPSGHVEMMLLATWCCRALSLKLFVGFALYTLCMTVSTIYLDYHYLIDLVAGAALAACLIALGPYLYEVLTPAHGPAPAWRGARSSFRPR